MVKDSFFIKKEIIKAKKYYLILTFSIVVTALLIGGMIGVIGAYALMVVVGVLIMSFIFIFRQDELAAIVVITIHLYLDWFVGLAFIGQIITLVLLFIYYLARSSRFPWVVPSALWLWIVLLVMAIFPSLRGFNALDGPYYYFNVIFSALIFYWLGLVLARDISNVRCLLRMFALFGAVLAIITIIQGSTGTLVFSTSTHDSWLVTVSNFQLSGSGGIARSGSYLLNPDSNGSFFALMFLIPLGLFNERSSLIENIFYIITMLLMLVALLFTYSSGGWITAGAGIVCFLIFAGRNSYRILIPLFTVAVVLILLVAFPKQMLLLLAHTLTPTETSLRIAAWETGINVIRAFPLTGLGMGRHVYFNRADPYRVPAQYIPLDHPHNSYIELAALGGIPLAVIFISLILIGLRLAFQNWIKADPNTRTLLACGLAVVLAASCNSIENPVWTLAPLAAISWLILGAISSPLLTNSLVKRKQEWRGHLNKERS